MSEHDLKFTQPLLHAEICDAGLLNQSSKAEDHLEENLSSAVEDETTVVLTRIAEAIDDVKLQLEPVAKELSAIAIGLAKMMVEKLVGESDTFQAKRLSLVLLKALSRAEPVVGVYLNPHNLDAVDQHAKLEPGLHKVKLHADERVPKGECRVEFDAHDLVSSLEQQLDEVEVRLQELIDDV